MIHFVDGKLSLGKYLGSCVQQEKNSSKVQKYGKTTVKLIRIGI
jgi:hypothetical protein